MRQQTLAAIQKELVQIYAQFTKATTQAEQAKAIKDLQGLIDQRGTHLDLDGIKERSSLRRDTSTGLFVLPSFIKANKLFTAKTQKAVVSDEFKAKIPGYLKLAAQQYRHQTLTQTDEELAKLQQALKTQHDAIKQAAISTDGEPSGITRLVRGFTQTKLEQRAQLMSRIQHINDQRQIITEALKAPANRKPPIQDELKSAFNQFSGSVDLGGAVQAAANELTHGYLIQDSGYTDFLKAQATANSALGGLPKTDRTNFVDHAIQVEAHLKNIKKTLPHENRQHVNRQKKYGELASQVPGFDRYINTHFATKGVAISKGFHSVFNELENFLYDEKEGISTLCDKVDKLSDELSVPTLSKTQATEKAQELEAAITKLQGKAQDFNEFLLRYSVRGNGLSMLSSVSQEKLNELADFSNNLLKETDTKAKRVKKFQLTVADLVESVIPSRLIEKLWDAGQEALDNRDSQTLVGKPGSGRRNLLVSNPNILTEYGKSYGVTVHNGTGFTGLNHWVEEEKLKDNEGNEIQLPIHGDERHGDKFSIIKLVEKTFPKNPQKHMHWSADGKTLNVTWHDDKEKKLWLDALKKLNGEYLKAEKKADEIEASLETPKPVAPVDASLATDGQNPGDDKSRRPEFIGRAQRTDPPVGEAADTNLATPPRTP